MFDIIQRRGISFIFVFALLAGSLLIGIAQIAHTPPFEGFDENAHYSYVEQFAETARGPKFGDRISAEVEALDRFIPLPATMGPQRTYKAFFDGSPEAIVAARELLRRARDPSRPWIGGKAENWQAQHPPLYYVLMAPAYRITKGWNLLDQLFLMRSVSYMVAWSGLILAVLACLQMPASGASTRLALALAPMLWPALFPTWFAEMARVGNDSLLVPIAAIAWMLLIRLDARPDALPSYALLGGVCGLGTLTKATFLPFVAGAAVYLLYRIWRASHEGIGVGRTLAGFGLFVLALCSVAGWWYVGRAFDTGSLLATGDTLTLERSGGLLAGLQKNGNLSDFVRGLLVVTPMTFLWSGTWSFVVPALPLFVPMFLLVGLLMLGLWRRRGDLLHPLHLVPLIVLALFCAGLTRHALVLMALLGPSVVPAWYLHSLMPVFSIVVGLGLAGAMSMSALRRFVPFLTFYPPVFLLFAMSGQALYYAGCPVKRPGLMAGEVISLMPCGLAFTTVYERLAALAYPGAATILMIAGWTLTMIGVWGAVRALKRLSTQSLTNATPRERQNSSIC